MAIYKRKILIIVMLFLGMTRVISQEEDSRLTNIFRLNFLNPGIGYDFQTCKNLLFSTDIGVGYSGAFEEITLIENNGFQYVIAPFLNVQYKLFYNRENRRQKGKSLIHNSGNFISVRARGRGPSISENLTRTDDVDFLIGPTWGFQRSYSDKFHFLFDIGPTYYFDTLGNSGFFPLNIQMKFGLNLISR